ncbi:alpha-amylase [Candidatus Merdisoma sp. JLR.KK006]|uniref:alpha-amylase n=1 Tax=Candidatus Merdisoma sp. JLR.KK006 TaxID=3112626 RepID=UPI002FEF5CB2
MKKWDKNIQHDIKEGILQGQGVRKLGEDICFTVAVPDKKACSLLLYKKGRKEAEAAIPMEGTGQYGDLRSLLVKGLPADRYEYNYEIDGQVVTDPYACRIAGRESFGKAVKEEELRGRICPGAFDWEGDRPLRLPCEEVVAYAAHVRGFTKHSTSKVKAKGTFAGLKEKIPYLKELGINQLELMPVYEFSELASMDNPELKKYAPLDGGEPRINYWGYSPKAYYFAPKASYAASDNPVQELKELIKELHRNGIELVLEFYFPKGTKASLVLNCIRYWVVEYHIDGVHINRDGAPVEALAQDPLLSHTKIFSESFALDEIYEEKAVPAFRNLAEYNDGFMLDGRRFLKGDEGRLTAFTWRARRSPARHGVINYMANHNGFTLMDLVSYDEKHNEANGEANRDGSNVNYSWNCGEEGPSRKKRLLKLRMQQLRNAFAILLLSQGTPLIYAGDERGNSQSGNNNAWCQDNEISWIPWKTGKTETGLLAYVKGLIAFRKAHPVFRQSRELQMTDYLSCGYPDVSYHGKQAWFADFENYSRSVGILYAGSYVEAGTEEKGKDDFFYVAYNMHWMPHEYALPGLPEEALWRVAVDTGIEGADSIYQEGQEPVLEDQRMITVPERTIMVLIGK